MLRNIYNPLRVIIDMKSVNQKLENIYQTLLKAYGSQGWWPVFNDTTGKIEYHKNDYSLPKNEQQRFEISVGAILTQNAAWKNVEASLYNLRTATVLSKNKIKNIEKERLGELIKSSVYHNQKTKKLKLFVDFLEKNNEITRESLLKVWGVGPETADSILLYAYKKPIFVVDAYTKRIFSRMGLTQKDATYDDMQQLFMKNLSNDVTLFNEYHALLVEHAKQYCKVKPLCKHCPLNKMCKKIIQ